MLSLLDLDRSTERQRLAHLDRVRGLMARF
jgi:hypothetical protein